MSAVSEWVVREYFESLGFLVSQPRKYVVPGRQKTAEEEVDLVVQNPRIAALRLPSKMVWGTEQVRRISGAVIGVRGWHTERFYASTFEQTPDILRFVEKESMQYASKLLNCTTFAKVLCLPRLPASGDLKKRTIETLKQKGVDGVISFQTMLIELIHHVDVKRNYEKSDILQVIRLLKNYDLLKADQMELFADKRRGKRRKKDESRECSED